MYKPKSTSARRRLKPFDVTLNDGKRTWMVRLHATDSDVAREIIRRDYVGVEVVGVRKMQRD